jgi:hypothetical protein
MMRSDEQAKIVRAVRLRKLIAESFAVRSPQERDRLLQGCLAQARGPARNASVLRGMTAFLQRARGRITQDIAKYVR